MNMVFDNLLLFYFILDVSLLVLIKHNILCLVPFLSECVSLVEHSHCFRQRLCQIGNERLAVHVRWWQVFVNMLNMVCFFQCSFFLILFFLLWVIKISIDWIISVSLPILIIDFSILLFHLFFYLLFMVLFVDISQDVELLFIVSQ